MKQFIHTPQRVVFEELEKDLASLGIIDYVSNITNDSPPQSAIVIEFGSQTDLNLYRLCGKMKESVCIMFFLRSEDL